MRTDSRRRPFRRPSRLSLVLSAGVTDSVGLAFGWTVFLLAVTERDGYDVATTQSAAALVGVAVSGPVSARLAGWLSPRDLLRVLAVAEGVCRVGLFGAVLAARAVRGAGAARRGDERAGVERVRGDAHGGVAGAGRRRPGPCRPGRR